MPDTPSPLVLPPGVMPPARPAPPPSGAPFDRNFFEAVLPAAIHSYCSQVACTIPLVQLYTSDGARHYIRAISAVADAWVALHTQEEQNEQPVQVFIPYPAIMRVEIHPDLSPDLRRFGFLTAASQPTPAELPAGPTER